MNNAIRTISHRVGRQPAKLPGVEWIAWQSHARTKNIADWFGIPVRIIKPKANGILRYLISTYHTINHLVAHRPNILIVQNPSLVLTLLTVLIRPLFRYRLVVDAHNQAVRPFVHTSPVILWLSKRLLRAADLTIVTNNALAEIVRSVDGNPFILPDRIPAIQLSGYYSGYCKGERPIGVFISTFAKDEPLEQFLEVVDGYDAEIKLFVTGQIEKLPQHMKERYSRLVTFTGFLSEKEYWELLESADFVIDLTTMDNCLVCGAYEAVALGKPAILSDNQATRELFRKGVIYVDNTLHGMRAGIAAMLEHREMLERDVRDLKDEMNSEWYIKAITLHEKMESLLR